MFIYGRNDWRTAERGEERCFLLTNGLGGYCSMTITGSLARDDHSLFMGTEQAPNYRYHYITNIQETLIINGYEYDLTSQSYVTETRNRHGYLYLQSFMFEDFPEWVFQIKGVTVHKQIVMTHEENTVAIRYRIRRPVGTQVSLHVCPLLKFGAKNHQPAFDQKYQITENSISSDDHILYFRTNGTICMRKEERIHDLYFAYDARDGRDAIGSVVMNHEIVFSMKAEEPVCGVIPCSDISCSEEIFELVYSTRKNPNSFADIRDKEVIRLRKLEQTAAFQNETANMLVKSADQFLVKRDSTAGDTIIAGYPFFGDWGRDTMIALLGCVIAVKQFDRAKSILCTFASYCRRGLMPNLFPEGEDEPLYNTVDASLWFIEAVYQYGKQSGDMDFVTEMLPVMKDIIRWYQKGTDYHIFMDQDGLISAGEGYEQVTWMDVRYEDILPTPRHGKPVEVNALWYNALCIMDELCGHEKAAVDEAGGSSYRTLALRVKESFLQQFWMPEKGYLKDVISLEKEREYADKQIRCNQVWALSLSFCMLDPEMSVRILDTIERELYTPYGLRSLSMEDPEFHSCCKGSQYHRDLAYHQGTVWGYPLGAYLIAVLRWKPESEGINIVREKLRLFESCLEEGCIGQMAEIYDGEFPSESRGCFAQAWSTGEMLRVYRELENRQYCAE